MTVLQGPSTFSGGGINLYGGRTLENQGSLTWAAGTFNLGSGSQDNVMIQNDAGANFDIENDLGIAAGSGTTAFINDGTVTQSVTTGTTNIGVAFTNSGTVSVGAGTLEFDGGFTSVAGSAISIASGATLDFASSISGTMAVTGASGGMLQFAAGQLKLLGSAFLGSIDIGGGTLYADVATIGSVAVGAGELEVGSGRG